MNDMPVNRSKFNPTKTFFMRLAFFALAGLLAISASAQDTSAYQRKEYQHTDGKVLPYRLLLPENYDKAKKYPMALVKEVMIIKLSLPMVPGFS